MLHIQLTELLNQFKYERTVSDKDLYFIYSYLFNNESTPYFEDEDLTDIIEHLKMVIEDHHLLTCDDLILYYAEEDAETSLFLDKIITEKKNRIKEHSINLLLNEVIHHNQIRRVMNIKVKSLPVESSNWMIGKFDPFENYMYALQHYYKKRVGEKLRKIFISRPEADHEMHGFHFQGSYSLKTKVLPLDSVNNVEIYYKQFTREISSAEVIVMDFHNNWLQQSIIKRKKKKTLISKLTTCSAIRKQYSRLNTMFSPDLVGYYQTLIETIQKEEPIKDFAIKEQLIQWIAFSKIQTLLTSNEHLNNQMEGCDWSESLIKIVTVFKSMNAGEMTEDMFVKEIQGQFKDMLDDKKWVILKSPRGSSWLTSNNPGICINLNEEIDNSKYEEWKEDLVTVKDGMIVYYPLSKEYCLRVQPTGASPQGHIKKDPSMIDFSMSTKSELNIVNGLTVSTNKGMVITSDEKALRESAMA